MADEATNVLRALLADESRPLSDEEKREFFRCEEIQVIVGAVFIFFCVFMMLF
jgi:hypothetical protein